MKKIILFSLGIIVILVFFNKETEEKSFSSKNTIQAIDTADYSFLNKWDSESIKKSDEHWKQQPEVKPMFNQRTSRKDSVYFFGSPNSNKVIIVRNSVVVN